MTTATRNRGARREEVVMRQGNGAQARTAGTGFACEHRVVRPDGTVRVLQARGEFHADAAGRPATMVGSAQDVTDRTRAQEAAQRLAAIV